MTNYRTVEIGYEKVQKAKHNALIDNKPNWFITNILLQFLMRNIIILFLVRFPAECDDTQVFTQNVDVQTTFPMAMRMYSMETKRFSTIVDYVVSFFRVTPTSNMDF